MQVILLERIGRLGQMGDVVNVKDGFARNFLLPQGKALRATKSNRERFERERSHLEARNLELKSEASSVSSKLDTQSFTIIRQAGDSGQLYGSVSTRDIADIVTAGGFSIERRQVMLDKPIKTLGLRVVRVSPHARGGAQTVVALQAEVETHIVINVARSPDEAARQARGEDVSAKAMSDAEDDALNARMAAPALCEEAVDAPVVAADEASEQPEA